MDSRWISTTSFASFAGVLLVRAQYTPQVDQWSIMMSTFIQGAAVACLFTPLVAVIVSGIPAEKIRSPPG
ncbi:hypothetical protein ACG02S_26050 [Roseateles sp. DC23W]|uniref:Uncharacterized protein n=1 Tax=Pelomonas dachongensis TaxID=3299029 RepID=A0ABW7EV61_9BURK